MRAWATRAGDGATPSNSGRNPLRCRTLQRRAIPGSAPGFRFCPLLTALAGQPMARGDRERAAASASYSIRRAGSPCQRMCGTCIGVLQRYLTSETPIRPRRISAGRRELEDYPAALQLHVPLTPFLTLPAPGSGLSQTRPVPFRDIEEANAASSGLTPREESRFFKPDVHSISNRPLVQQRHSWPATRGRTGCGSAASARRPALIMCCTLSSMAIAAHQALQVALGCRVGRIESNRATVVFYCFAEPTQSFKGPTTRVEGVGKIRLEVDGPGSI